MRLCQHLLKRARKFSQFRTKEYIFEEPKTSLCLTLLQDEPGSLNNCLNAFSQSGINLTRIESKPVSTLDKSKGIQIIVDFDDKETSPKVQQVIKDLKNLTQEVTHFGGYQVPNFPRYRSDLDNFSKKTLSGGEELESDHPGFHDEDYKMRRHQISQIAYDYKSSDPEVPRIDYNEKETEVWALMFKELKKLHLQYAVPEHLQGLEEMEKYCGFKENNIPQLADISNYLQNKTNFYIRPVTGLLTARDFLNGLAFRTFFSTQYIRHHSCPRYTPEPDIIHELMGHAPLFANEDFANFSQEIGMASLGASDEEVNKLATNYWFSIEFGIILNNKNERKVYGAGVLSSMDELLHSISDQAKIMKWDPYEAATIEYPITTVQPLYMYTRSFKEACALMKDYSDSVTRHFNVTYNKLKDCMEIDRKVKAMPVE